MKNMGINTIRLEGHLMPEDFYEQMDAGGHADQRGLPVLRRLGTGEQRSDQQRRLRDHVELRRLAIAQNMRNHPSVFSFQWSD